MIPALALSLSLFLTAGSDGGTTAPRVELGPISIKVPVTWQRRDRSGSHRFDAPKGNAYFVVDTSEVKTAGMEPSICLGKIIDALGNEGGGEWNKLMLGGFPAAHRASTDVGKGGSVTVRTHTFVGCNGVNTWLLLFHLDDKAAAEYEPQIVTLAKSLQFVSPEDRAEPISPGSPDASTAGPQGKPMR
jgi:hypothetical protein